MDQTGRFFFICSNGRCGTQFLARQLAALSEDAWVIHEKASVAMASGQVFRDPQTRLKRIVSQPNLERFFNKVDRVTRKGGRIVFCGWPGYSYVDYLQERLGTRFAFVHLLRNPYENAASHATHHPMLPHYPNEMQDMCKIFGTNPNLVYRQFADRYGGFGTYNRQLLHWLELSRYLRECEDLPGFQRRVRFEDLFADGGGALDDLASRALGCPVTLPDRVPFDRVHRPNVGHWRFDADAELVAEVDHLAEALGYTQAELTAARDETKLQQRYARQRYALPCDPSLPVIAPEG